MSTSTFPLKRWQRLEALMAILAVVAMTVAGSWLGSRLVHRFLDGPATYAPEARDRVDTMLSVLHRAPVQRAIPHRRCYGSDQLSPCVELITQEGLTLQVLGPAFRLAVMLPGTQTDLAVALKRQADHVDRDGVANASVLSMLLGGMGKELVDGPTAANTRARAQAQVDDAVALMPSTLHAFHREAVPTVVNGTILWRLAPDGRATTTPLALDASPAVDSEHDVWWFTVPLVLAGPALQALHDHPLPHDQRLDP